MAEPSQIVCSPALPRAAASFDHDQISIVIVDDHELLRDLLVPALRGAGDFNLVGQAEDGESAIELCKRLRPPCRVGKNASSLGHPAIGCISELRPRVGGRRRGAFQAPAASGRPPAAGSRRSFSPHQVA